MPNIHEVATLTSKGQITVPKAIRKALGVDAGEKLAFDFTENRLIVTRIESEKHADPAIRGFLSLLEKDIETGQHISSLPESLVQSMQATLGQKIELEDEIEGEVEL